MALNRSSLNNSELSDYPLRFNNISTQYWHPRSAKFAGGDNFVTAIFGGWEVDGPVHVKRHRYTEARFITVYHFRLKRGNEEMDMPVIYTPYIERLIEKSDVDVVNHD